MTSEAKKISSLFGFDMDEVKKELNEVKSTTEEARGRDAEALISYTYNPRGWEDKVCKGCRRHFATNYRYVSYCSTKCREKALQAVGLQWDWTKTDEERYTALRIEPPAIISPEAMAALLEVCRRNWDILHEEELAGAKTVYPHH